MVIKGDDLAKKPDAVYHLPVTLRFIPPRVRHGARSEAYAKYGLIP